MPAGSNLAIAIVGQPKLTREIASNEVEALQQLG